MVPESNLSQTCKDNKFLSHKHVIKEQINVIAVYILLQKVSFVFWWKAFENFPECLNNIILLSEENISQNSQV